MVGTAEAAQGRGLKAEAAGLGSLAPQLGEKAFWGLQAVRLSLLQLPGCPESYFGNQDPLPKDSVGQEGPGNKPLYSHSL